MSEDSTIPDLPLGAPTVNDWIVYDDGLGAKRVRILDIPNAAGADGLDGEDGSDGSNGQDGSDASVTTANVSDAGAAMLVGGNTFLGAQYFTGGAPTFAWRETDQPADQQQWSVNLFNGTWRLVSTTNAGGFQSIGLSVERDGKVTTSNDVIVPDDAYSASWDGDLAVPTRNAVYDKMAALEARIAALESA